jgi:hypothetical protein
LIPGNNEIDLSEGKTEKIYLNLKVMEKMKPYVAVISADNDPDLQREITGSLIKSNF